MASSTAGERAEEDSERPPGDAVCTPSASLDSPSRGRAAADEVIAAEVTRKLSRETAARRMISDEQRRTEAAVQMQAAFRARHGRQKYTRVRRILMHMQARFRGDRERKASPLVEHKAAKKTRNERSAAYKSAVTPRTLDWRLESLKARHERITWLALAGVVAVIVINEMVFSDWKAQLLGEKERFGSAVLALRVGLLISTVLLEALLVDYHRFFFRSAKQLFGTTVMPGRYALLVGRDVLLCAVHPFIDGGLLRSEEAWEVRTSAQQGGLTDLLGIRYLGVEDLFVIVSVIMFLRVPLVLFRRLWLHSKANRMKARFLARSYHIDLSLQLAIRVEMRDTGVQFLLSVTLAAVFCFGYVYYVLEREYAFVLRLEGSEGYDSFTSPEFFLNALWSNVIVLIGMGFDYPPQTALGRLTLVVNAVSGLALFALMTAAFAEALSLKDAELRLMHVVQRSEGVLRIQTAAVRVIQRAWKHTHHRKSMLHSLPRWARQRIPGAPLSPAAKPLLVMRGVTAAHEGRFPASPAGASPRAALPVRLVHLPTPCDTVPASDGGGHDGGAEQGGRQPRGSTASSLGVLRFVRKSTDGAASEASLPDTPTRQRRAEAVRKMRESVLNAADAQLRKQAEGRHHKALMRALNDWRVERHRNATTTEMIENVASILKEVRERQDGQAAELSRVCRWVESLARHSLPPSALAEPARPTSRSAAAQRAGVGRARGKATAVDRLGQRKPLPPMANPPLPAQSAAAVQRARAATEGLAGGVGGASPARKPLQVSVQGAAEAHSGAKQVAGSRSATVTPLACSAAPAREPADSANGASPAERVTVLPILEESARRSRTTSVRSDDGGDDAANDASGKANGGAGGQRGR